MIKHCGPALALLSCSTSAAAQLAAPYILSAKNLALAADVPAIWARSSSKLRSYPDGRLLAARATPLLDGLFMDRDTVARTVRRRSYRFDLGAIALGVEAVRLQGRASDLLSMRSDTNRPRKTWATGFTSELALGSNDRLSLGVAAGSYRNPPSTAVETDPRATTSLRRLGLTWARGDQWQLGLGWQKDGGTTRGASDRMVEIANGAPLHEQGLRLSVALRPWGSRDPHQNSFGLEARHANISSADVAVIGSGARQDLQETLYFRRQF